MSDKEPLMFQMGDGKMTPIPANGEAAATPIEKAQAGYTQLKEAGLLAFVVSWSMSGLSLGFTLQAVSNESFQIHGWPVWTGAVAIATVVGFLAVFAPGGMGVREGMLLEVLSVQPDIGEKQAVFAALLLRLVWIVAEIAMATALYYMVKPPKDRPEETEGR